MLLRCTLRILAFWCLGALLIWLIVDLQPKLDPRAEALQSFRGVDICGRPPPGIRDQIIRDAEEEHIRRYKKQKAEHVISVEEVAFCAILTMFFSMLAFFSLLIDWNTLRLHYPLPAKS